ncbi:MAG: hypothetical protein HQ488_05510 [Parcubacteria group bacterium]|nr:hypothetical protein [Parcubacteria group bacterium]
MSFRSYLILMSLASVAAWIAWVVVLHGIDPSASGFMGLILFYATLSIALFGSISVFGVLFRLWKDRSAIVLRVTLQAFRQALLLTALFVSSLILFSQGWFRWWTMFLVVIIVGFVELAFISQKRRY